MGFQAVSAGLDGSELNLGYTPLIQNGLKYINFFGGSSPIKRNLFGNNAQQVGAPVAGAMSEGTQFTQRVNYLDSGVPHSKSMTLLAVVKCDARSLVISNNNTPALGVNISLALSKTAQGTYFAQAYYGVMNSGGTEHSTKLVNTSALALHQEGEYVTIAIRFNDKKVAGETFLTVSDLTSAVSNALKADGSVYTQDLGPSLLIGSGFISWFDGKPRVLFSAIWDRELTDDELAKQYSQLKKFYAGVKGVSV